MPHAATTIRAPAHELFPGKDLPAPAGLHGYRDRKRWGWLLSVAGPGIAASGTGAHLLGATHVGWFFVPLVVFYLVIPHTSTRAVWELTPAADRLKCIFVSENRDAGNGPDNITVSPRGGILICEVGGTSPDEFGPGARLFGLNTDGTPFQFAKNNLNFTRAQSIHSAQWATAMGRGTASPGDGAAVGGRLARQIGRGLGPHHLAQRPFASTSARMSNDCLVPVSVNSSPGGECRLTLHCSRSVPSVG